jgi:tRNA threonylcarbamoyladenosine biosynthesis protein TsaE
MLPGMTPCPAFATATLGDEARMRAFARALAPQLAAGDAVLLTGPVGAGKTALARALIGALLARAGAPAEEVPSPSYTLVQTYRAGETEIWHADLYRLGDAGELTELGLDDAYADAIAVIEWADRLGPLAPPDALWVDLAPVPGRDTARAVRLAGPRRWHWAADALTAPGPA